MSKLIVALALCSSSVRAQTGRGLAKDNLSGGLDWSHGRRLDGPVDDNCEGGGPSHRFDSRLECCENLDAYDLDTFCTGSCPSAGCVDLGGPHLKDVVDLKGSGCLKFSDGVRFWVHEGPWNIEVTATGGTNNNQQGIQNIEVKDGAHDVAIAVTGNIWQGITSTENVNNLLVDIKAGGEIKEGVSFYGPNGKFVIQSGGTHKSNIYAYYPNAEIDIKGRAHAPTNVKAQNTHIHIHDGADILSTNYAINVWAANGYPNYPNGNGDGLTVVNNGPRAVTITKVDGTPNGVTCNGASFSWAGNSYSCPSVAP